MADARPFSFEGLFAKSTPPGRPAETVKRGKYDFAVAYPDPASVPLNGLVESLQEALNEDGRDLAVYPHPQGYLPLREYVSGKLAKERDIHVPPEEIILGDGSGQPIRIVTEALVEPGDVVLTEDWVYSGTLGTLRRQGADVRGVQCDGEGMLPDALEGAVTKAIGQGKRPKFIYTIPTFQNPQGWVMSLERRKAMVELCQKYGVPILEDDCYVDLRYEGEPVASLHSLDDSGLVMYVASFSKIIAPGMRMGYLTGSPEFMAKARAVKAGHVNEFAARAVYRYATKYMDSHIDEINNIQRAKRDAMVAALGENFGSAATWSNPPGGLFVWLQLHNEQADLARIRDRVLDTHDVGYHPGNLFAPDGVSGKNFARLCFGYNTPEEIHEGVARLAEAFDKEGMLKG